MTNKPLIFGSVLVLLTLLFLLPQSVFYTHAQKAEAGIDASPANRPSAPPKSLAGKTIWIIDINTNETYESPLQQALLEQLPKYAPGSVVRHVPTNAKGNPFFILRREDFPDATVISLGVCYQTTKLVANYASAALKKGIPTVMCYLKDVREDQMKWNGVYLIPNAEAIEIEENMPQDKKQAMAVAEILAPELVERIRKQLI